MECIVHFEVLHPEGPKHLRGLLFLDDDMVPDEAQLVGMFKSMKFDVRLENREKLVFKPVNAGANFSAIRITELDTGQEKYKDDRELQKLVAHLLPQKPMGL